MTTPNVPSRRALAASRGSTSSGSASTRADRRPGGGLHLDLDSATMVLVEVFAGTVVGTGWTSRTRRALLSIAADPATVRSTE